MSIAETDNSSLISNGAAWQENTDNCTVCDAALGKRHLNARHHCRMCGRCACDRCTPNRVVLHGKKDQRVCTPCVASLATLPQLAQQIKEATRKLRHLVPHERRGSLGASLIIDEEHEKETHEPHDLIAAVKGLEAVAAEIQVVSMQSPRRIRRSESDADLLTEVVLDVSEASKLGMTTAPARMSVGRIINNIGEGPVRRGNENNPDQKIQKGDVILAANGQELPGDPKPGDQQPKLLDYAVDGWLRLTVQRHRREDTEESQQAVREWRLLQTTVRLGARLRSLVAAEPDSTGEAPTAEPSPDPQNVEEALQRCEMLLEEAIEPLTEDDGEGTFFDKVRSLRSRRASTEEPSAFDKQQSVRSHPSMQEASAFDKQQSLRSHSNMQELEPMEFAQKIGDRLASCIAAFGIGVSAQLADRPPAETLADALSFCLEAADLANQSLREAKAQLQEMSERLQKSETAYQKLTTLEQWESRISNLVVQSLKSWESQVGDRLVGSHNAALTA
jgi:hypothetical protein